jgi:AcrR family transcriptional regulator
MSENSRVARRKPQKDTGSPAAASRKISSSRNELLRDQALKVAAKLFAERGFAGANLQDIADAAGISRPGLYYYFKNKEAILEALTEDLAESANAQAAAFAARHGSDAAEDLRDSLFEHALWLLQHGLALKVVDRSESHLPPRLLDRHRTARSALSDAVRDTIDRGVVNGRFRPVDARLTANSVLGMCNWIAWSFEEGGETSARDIAAELSELSVRGLLRADAHRHRNDRIGDALQILQEDVQQLQQLVASKGLA